MKQYRATINGYPVTSKIKEIISEEGIGLASASDTSFDSRRNKLPL